MKFASGLLNYIEPVYYNGTYKCAFYSEFSTNLEVGDKVYIVNGNYDSDVIISNSNFTEGIDGYNVLSVDKCRIVLDIDYSGALPYNEDDYDNFIKIYHIRSQQEFEYINNICSNTYTTQISKFEYGLTNNIIYVDTAMNSGSGIYGSYSSLSNSGFYQKNNSSGNWINLPSLTSTSSIYFNISGPGITYSQTNNNRLLIVGEDITINNLILKQRGIYKFDTNSNTWVYDIVYNKPYISKLNFRSGKFNGTWNDGIFGSYINQAKWNGGNSIWNSGIFINSIWNSGVLNSKSDVKNINSVNISSGLYDPHFTVANTEIFNISTYTNSIIPRTINYNSPNNLLNNNVTQYYYTSLSNNKPLQTTDYSNNKGFGFNYIIDSNIEKANINNGNFINCNIGMTNYGVNTIDVYYGLTFSYNILINNGYYRLCDIDTSAFNNSYIIDSNVINSNISNSRLSSNQIKGSVANGSEYNVNPITVISADIWSYHVTSNNIRGVLKLFISDEDLLRVNTFEEIYIDKINKEVYLSYFNDETKTYINIENKYIFYYIKNNNISSDSILVSIKNKTENKYKNYVSKVGSNYVNSYSNNNNNYASIDIDLGSDISWYYDNSSNKNIYNNSIINSITINGLFSNIPISNSSFNTGLISNSNWRNGDYINDPFCKIALDINNNLSIIVNSGGIFIDIVNDYYNDYYTFNTNEYVWINGIDYIIGTYSYSIDNVILKIDSVNLSPLPNSTRLGFTEISNVLSLLPSGGIFSIKGEIKPNYISINKFKIINSHVENGLFKTALMTNTTVINDNFNNKDQNLKNSNISQLRFINTLFKNDNNIINNGLVYKSHLVNSKWNNGLLYNSIVYGLTFSNGIFKNGYWIFGNFENGLFIDSTDIITTTMSYDDTNVGYYRSWRNGEFNGGQFYNSIWIDGKFNTGRFYNSKWYGGEFNGGILGLKNTPYLITTMGYYPNIGTGSTFTTVNGGLVESAIIGGSSSIYWNNGIFNDGEFTSNGGQFESIWYGGTFNGGKFNKLARWKNGTFNGGKFLSYYGYTNSSSTFSFDYSWENGTFNGGQFGYINYGTNSTWYNGTFNGGIFGGKVWNYGIFIKGTFIGSSTTQSYMNEFNFVNQFTNSYYGLWRDGYVVETLHSGNPNVKVSTNIPRVTDTKKVDNIAIIKNTLWLNGTFSHNSATIINSVWLNGTFNKGTFENSSFNPWVDRTFNGSYSLSSFNLNNTCVWYNGTLNSSAFYISEWKNGTFNSGYMLGGIWRNGTWFYGTAENIYWENGDWKNGNWYGTNFKTTSSTYSMVVNDNKIKNILYNIANVSGTSSLHLLNAFTGSIGNNSLYDPSFNKMRNIGGFGDYRGWTQGQIGTGWTYSDIFSYTSYFSGPPTSISVNDNHLYTYGNGGSNLLIGMSQSTSFTYSIFKPNTAYNISLNIFVDYNPPSSIYTGRPIILEIAAGYYYSPSYSVTMSCTQGYNTINLSLSSDASLWTTYTSQFTIKKLASSDIVAVRILDVNIYPIDINYSSTYNNQLYTPYATTATISNITLPSLVKTVVGDGNLVSLQYGNGKFVSGVWENGIWENGYRDDTTLLKCELYSISNYIKMSNISHRIQLSILGTASTYKLYNVGDYVTIGNIIGIDVNNQRKLLKDKFRVIYVDSLKIVLEYTIISELLTITKDSPNHIIYVTKNMWLSGGFLNGKFSGVWNYGLFKGYPYITSMENSHWVDGIFDGGHFLSMTASLGANSVDTINYNTGLIQNFNFNDRNISTSLSITNSLYQSWIDVNYDNSSQVNINRSSKNYVETIVAANYLFKFYYNDSNLYGMPTYDVLSSNSYFRNSYSLNGRFYKLGTKQSKYYNFIPNNGNFEYPVRHTGLTSNDVNLYEFIKNGWTISDFTSLYGYTTSYYSNLSYDTSNILLFTMSSIGGLPIGGNYYNTLCVDNSYITTLPNRYYILETKLSETPFLNAMSYDVGVPSQFDHTTSNSLTKTEYYFNKASLLLYLSGINGMSVKIENLSFYEVDMIPFFKYATQSNIDKAIHAPYEATAPYIDYTNANYNYIGNIKLNVNPSLLAGKEVITPYNSDTLLLNTRFNTNAKPI